jgi:membrane associated rhomboid family serine protease
MFFPFHDDNPTRRTAYVAYAIVAINVLGFFWFSRQARDRQDWVVMHRGFVPARIAQLSNPHPLEISRLVKVRHPKLGKIPARRVITLQPDRAEILLSLLTCMFMHGGWMHLIGNMWFLWLFGNNVEDRLGHVLFLLFYLVGGLLASGCHWWFHADSLAPVIGASGAVAAVLGAYAVTWPWARVRTLVFLVVFVTIIDVPALLVLGVWFVGQVIAGQRALQGGVQAAPVAWWAHVGGFLAGMILMSLLDRRGIEKQETDD